MKVLLNNRVYDVLKWVCIIVLPAAASLYLAVAGLWGWPHTKEVVGTIAAIETFLGALLGVSSAQYKAEGEEKAADSDE